MDREGLFRVLVESVNEFAGRDYAPEDIDRSRSVFDYGVDSLNVMQILAEIEEAMGTELDLGALSESDVTSIDSLLDYLSAAREWTTESA